MFLTDIFKKLEDKYYLRLKSHSKDKESLHFEYCSKDFVIIIEQYHREVYVSLYKIDNSDFEIDLFNLLEFLRIDEANITTYNYFHNEKNYDECLRLQLENIAMVIYENYSLISDFFNKDSYELNIIELNNYWKNKHPEFYRTV